MQEQSPDNAGVLAPPPLIYGGPLIAGLLLEKVFPLSLLRSGTARLLGLMLIALSFLIVVPAFVQMHRAATSIRPERPTTALVVEGPFRYSRNPIYLSLTILYIGVSLFCGSLWAIALLPAVLWVMSWGVIAREERYLERKFRDGYRNYAARVRRWL